MSKLDDGDSSADPRVQSDLKPVLPRAGKRLDSWKEIAEYIGRDVRTAHRWESGQGLPVHRLIHDRGATVYALTAEIDEWMAKRSASPQTILQAEPPPAPPIRRRWALWTAAGVVLAAGLAAGVWVWLPANRAGTQVHLPTPLTADAGWEWGPQLSPDGRTVAYTQGGSNEGPLVVIQLIGGGRPVEVAGSERNTHSPTWSSDGKSLSLLRVFPHEAEKPSDLIVLPAFGGEERRIAGVFTPTQFHDWQPGPYIDWSPDDRFLAVCESPGKSVIHHRITIVSVATGEKSILTGGVEKIFGDYSPRFSPDGRRIAFSRVSAYGVSDVFVLDLTPDMRPAAAPVRIPSASLWNASPVWTPDGQRLVFLSGTLRNTRLSVADADGNTAPELLPLLDSGYGPFDLASMGKNELRLVYTRIREDSNIWRIPLNRLPVRAADLTKVVDSSFVDANPRLSPDGTKFAFVSNRTGDDEIWIANLDSPQPQQLTKLKGGVVGRPSWSPDGSRIAFDLRSKGTGGIYEVGVADGRLQQLVRGVEGEGSAAYSPDGKRIYFSSRRSGAPRIWSIPASGGEPVILVDIDAKSPGLLPAGNGVVYQGPDGVVRLQPLPEGKREQVFSEVFSADHVDSTEEGIYGVAARGKERRQNLIFYSFARRQVQELFEYPNPPTMGLSVARDGKFALGSMKDHLAIDLMMVDGVDIRP